MKKIIFRADGNSITGLGHLYRLFSLVEIINNTYDLVFLTHETSTDSVIPKAYKKITIPKEISLEAEPDWLATNFSPKEYIIIADGYQFTATYQKQIKQKGYKLVYIDDLAHEHMYADVVINHSPHIQEKDYKKETYTKLALGTQFALLRPLFLKKAKLVKTIKKVDSAFVCFGGADPFNLTIKAVEGLLQVSSFKKIHVVLGGAYKNKEIFDLEKRISHKIKIYRNLSEEDLINTMQQCNFAIAPASTILYELCCIKMPILSGYYVENQKNIYIGLLKKQAIIETGNFSSYTNLDFKNSIESYLETKVVDSFLLNQLNLFDGNSKNRLLGVINQLSISFRKAEEKDVLLVYKWSNDIVVRQNSYNSEPIKLEDHKKWFSRKIKDKNTFFLIALVNNKPAGIVRYELEKNASVVGVMISKEYRGQRLASEFLKVSAKLFFVKYNLPILAYIKKENKPSIKAFENARYKYLKDENVEGNLSYVYKLEKNDVTE